MLLSLRCILGSSKAASTISSSLIKKRPALEPAPLWSNDKIIILLNFWSPLLSKTYFISEQFILLLASTFKPIGSLSSTDENMTKDKVQRFRKGESDSTEATSRQFFL